MEKLPPSEKLKRAVESLEEKKKIQEEYLKYEMHDLLDSLKPGNLLRGAVHNVVGDPGARRKVIGAGIGLATAAISKNLISRTLNHVASRITSSLFQFIGKKFKKKK